MYYFAYGVNLNLEKMQAYCPGAKFIGPAFVMDHELVFDGQSIRRPGATANIRAKKGSTLWGALFKISNKELAELDDFENYPISYQRKSVTAIGPEEKMYDSTVLYFREGEREGKPGESYFVDLIEGAGACGLPTTYITALEERIRSAGFAS